MPGERDADLDAARRLLDGGRLDEGLAAIDALLARDPLDAAAHLERAVALTELGHPDAAEDACRRALYLWRSEEARRPVPGARGHPFVHFFVGLLRLGRGDRAGAAASLRTAHGLATRLPPAEVLAHAHGMTAGALAEAAAVQLARAEGDGPDRP